MKTKCVCPLSPKLYWSHVGHKSKNILERFGHLQYMCASLFLSFSLCFLPLTFSNYKLKLEKYLNKIYVFSSVCFFSFFLKVIYF